MAAGRGGSGSRSRGLRAGRFWSSAGVGFNTTACVTAAGASTDRVAGASGRNLTWGGTGKTPVVEKFARALRDRGRKVAILSRGYKSKSVPLWRKAWWRLTHAEEPPPRIVSDGERFLGLITRIDLLNYLRKQLG